jgi:outer membrane protein assembly factor BamD
MIAPRRIAAVLVSGLLVGQMAGCGGHILPALRSESDRLSTARKMAADREYGDAIELLKPYTTSGGGAADVDQAIFLLADCYLQTKEYALAATEYERLLNDYPESDSAGSSSFRLGEAYYGQSRKADFDQEYTLKAIEQWQKYLHDYPGHWRNPEAEGRLLAARSRLAQKFLDTGTLYLKLRLFQPSRVYFQRVLDDYSDTSLVADARLGLALADAGQGRRDEAIAALREIEAQYPRQAVAERAASERRRLEHKKG